MSDAVFVHGAVQRAPDGAAHGRRDGDDAPVGAEVLHPPDDADDDRRQREHGAIADAVQGGNEREEARVVLHHRRREQDLPDRKKESAGDEQCHPGELWPSRPAFAVQRRTRLGSEPVRDDPGQQARNGGTDGHNGDIGRGGIK